MRRSTALLGAVLLVIAACGGDDSADTTTTTAAPATTAAGDATTTAAPAGGSEGGLIIEAIDFEAGTIALRNTGGTAIDLGGFWICNRPNYAQLPDETLEAGATTTVPTSTIGLGPGGGELGVYTDRAFDNPDAMVAYVAWGSAGQGRQGTAAEAGLWGADDFVDNGGAAIQSQSDNPVTSADWSSG